MWFETATFTLGYNVLTLYQIPLGISLGYICRTIVVLQGRRGRYQCGICMYIYMGAFNVHVGLDITSNFKHCLCNLFK